MQSYTWSTFMASAEGPRKGNPDVTWAIQQKPTELLSAPITTTCLNWHSAVVRGKDSDQRCVYIKVLPCHSDNWLLCHAYQTGTPYQQTKKRHCRMRLLVRISFHLSYFLLVHAECFKIHTDILWYLCCKPFVYGECGVLSKSVEWGGPYFELCLSIGRGRRWALGNQSDIKPDMEWPTRGQWGVRVSSGIINTEHKALRCSLRRFTSPLSGTGKRAAKPKQWGQLSHADGDHGGSFFPDETLLVDGKNVVTSTACTNLQTAR